MKINLLQCSFFLLAEHFIYFDVGIKTYIRFTKSRDTLVRHKMMGIKRNVYHCVSIPCILHDNNTKFVNSMKMNSIV